MKKNKWYITAGATAVILCLLAATASAGVDSPIHLVLNGQKTDVKVMRVGEELYIPLKAAQDALGATVQWNSQSNTVHMDVAGEDSLPALIQSVSPSVVGIIGKLKPSSTDYMDYGDNVVFGSGVIYTSSGYIITNAHVVGEMDYITVVLSSGKSYAAKLKLLDEETDLAIIKIDKGGLVPAKFGSLQEIVVGKEVVAIGTPMSFSLRNSASRGIISGINRTADSAYRYIQSDTSINPGNSGGPLIDMQGNVIGINSMKYTGIGVEGLSFSIPIDTVQYVIEQYQKYGRIRRPFTGLTLGESIAARYGLPVSEGLIVIGVEKDSPAAKAGIGEEDVLHSINGVAVNNLVEYNEALKQYTPGDIISASFKRNGKEVSVKIKLAEAIE